MGATAGIRNSLNYKRVKLEEWGGGHWFEPVLNIHKPLYPTLNNFFFICPLFISVAKRKKCSMVDKFLEAFYPLPATPLLNYADENGDIKAGSPLFLYHLNM